MYLYILHYSNDNTALDYVFCEGAAFELLFMITKLLVIFKFSRNDAQCITLTVF